MYISWIKVSSIYIFPHTEDIRIQSLHGFWASISGLEVNFSFGVWMA